MAVVLGSITIAAGSALAQKRYGPVASDTEIKIGNIVPYSGPVSAAGVNGKTIAAYFNKVNVEGGINGRKIRFISYDDAYSPPKTVEQARRLIESDEVLLIFYSTGTPTNSAIQRYMNTRKVPQLFVASGAVKWKDPRNFPWTMGWAPSNQGRASRSIPARLTTRRSSRMQMMRFAGEHWKLFGPIMKGALAGG